MPVRLRFATDVAFQHHFLYLLHQSWEVIVPSDTLEGSRNSLVTMGRERVLFANQLKSCLIWDIYESFKAYEALLVDSKVPLGLS